MARYAEAIPSMDGRDGRRTWMPPLITIQRDKKSSMKSMESSPYEMPVTRWVPHAVCTHLTHHSLMEMVISL